MCTRCLRSGKVQRGYGSGLAKLADVDIETPVVNTFEVEEATENSAE